MRFVMAIAGIALVAGGPVAAESTTKLESEKDKVSYMLGMDLGNSLRQFSDDVDMDIVIQAMRAVLSGSDLAMSSEEARTVKQEFFKKMKEKKEHEKTAQSAKNRAEGEKFLAENKNREGVMVTDSGLQYEVLTAGTGAKPAETERVKVHYRGTLIDGTEFDSSYKRGQPATFNLNGVIKGWTEALQLMPAGSKYKLYIPSELAYGSRGTQGPIGPDSTLIFEVELIEIVK